LSCFLHQTSDESKNQRQMPNNQIGIVDSPSPKNIKCTATSY